MPRVVCEPCIGCKSGDCVSVCPVECFHETPEMLVIDPHACIDCGLCATVCPSRAIFSDEDVPERWQDYIEKNVDLARRWPNIREIGKPKTDRRAG